MTLNSVMTFALHYYSAYVRFKAYYVKLIEGR